MSYEITGAVVNDQGIKFAIVEVNHDVAKNINENTRALDAYEHLFPDMPIILLGRDPEGQSTYYGNEHLAYFLADLDPNCIPWRRFIITD